jgi:hypothetical protein
MTDYQPTSEELHDYLRRRATRIRRFGDFSHVQIDSGDDCKPEPLPDHARALWLAAWEMLPPEDQKILHNARQQIGF